MIPSSCRSFASLFSVASSAELPTCLSVSLSADYSGSAILGGSSDVRAMSLSSSYFIISQKSWRLESEPWGRLSPTSWSRGWTSLIIWRILAYYSLARCQRAQQLQSYWAQCSFRTLDQVEIAGTLPSLPFSITCSVSLSLLSSAVISQDNCSCLRQRAQLSSSMCFMSARRDALSAYPSSLTAFKSTCYLLYPMTGQWVSSCLLCMSFLEAISSC